MFSIKVGQQLSLLRFLESDGLEKEICFGWVQASNQVGRLFDFRCRYRTKRMGRNLLGWASSWGIRDCFCRHDGNVFHSVIWLIVKGSSRMDRTREM